LTKRKYLVNSSKALPFSSLLKGKSVFLKSFQEFTFDIIDLKEYINKNMKF
jgi:hypothetical protein